VNPIRRTLLAGVAGAAYWAGPSRAQATPEPIRLGLIEGLSGPFGNAGEAVFRNILWAVERVNRRGGVRVGGVLRPLALARHDSKGSTEEALSTLRAAIDDGVNVVLQGNSSAVAAALSDAVDKHNERAPKQRVLFLNYSAVDPALTNERCSFWHFRFDAHADMRLAALVEALQADRAVQRLYLIGQDYSFGQHVLRQARALVTARRPDVQIVGDELHPLGRVKDFVPYATKIKASGAQAVLTPNWGNDLALLVRALREVGSEARLYTFYGNALGTPSAIGDAGVGRVLAVAEWHPNLGGAPSDALVMSFRQRFPSPQDDYLHLRMQLMVEMLAAAIERAGSTEAAAVALALEGMDASATPFGWHGARMRAADHQLQQPLVVSVMERAGSLGVTHDIEGSGYGFRTLRRFEAAAVQQPHTCRMQRPD
jgi:branched-chain amino acid transport system substrate-binding protein